MTTAEGRAAIQKDMAQTPTLVLVDDRAERHAISTLPVDFVELYQKDPAFAKIWANYTAIPSCMLGIRAFCLRENWKMMVTSMLSITAAVIPCFRAAATLRDVVAEMLAEIERIYCVNDASDDNFAEVLADWPKKIHA